MKARGEGGTGPGVALTEDGQVVPVVVGARLLLHTHQIHVALETQPVAVGLAAGPLHAHDVPRGLGRHVLKARHLTDLSWPAW